MAVTEYLDSPIGFKIRKVVRYVGLFGLSRTLAKVRGNLHMASERGFEGSLWQNPKCRNPDHPERRIGLIGCGLFAFANIAHFLEKKSNRFLRAGCDIHAGRARSLVETYGGAYATTEVQTIIDDPEIDLVYIASNHASHAEYAIQALAAGKHVHIEKPHAVSQDQLDRLIAAMEQNPNSKVFLGFNRPRSRFFRKLQGYVAKETGPLMINWFIAGHEIADGHWYFDAKEGGRVLGNLCHWTDLTLQLVSMEKAFPCEIVPATPSEAKSDFVVSVIFADRSCASITFSAKGHVFEGVREVLNLQKGNMLANLTDFRHLSIDVGEKKRKFGLFHRGHGHEANIIHSLDGVSNDKLPGEDVLYVAATGKFVLAIRQAIDTGKIVNLSWKDITGPTE